MLQHLRDLLAAAGYDAIHAVADLFSTTGFTEDLAAEAAASRGKSLLVTLEWAALRHSEILANWERARRSEPLLRIDPLA
ncbi:MAG: hypothetical protein ACRDNF_10970 [Streptosporangiaceae bacterium]